jgi:SdiA-regulated
MAFYRFFTYAFLIAGLFLGCTDKEKKIQLADNSRYDLLNPFVIKLPEGLAEISGLVYYPKDTSVFAIEDENGFLYKISLTTNAIMKWKFDKRHDFEDVVLRDSVFYILISNGDIETLQFGSGDSMLTNKFIFPDAGKKKNEFESMYFDDSLKQLILLCKDCADDKKRNISAWGFNIDNGLYSSSVLSVDVQPISKELDQKKIKLKPSAATINPVTNELYILEAINNLLIVTDRNGRFKEIFTLPPAIYKQPEGIAFTPAGDMIISNEWHETGLANILIIKNKRKDL